jgi:sulfate adenylyltransferase subunit 1
VQTVIRPHQDEYHDFRGYAGRIAGGIFRKGDEVVALPSGLTSKITNIQLMDENLEEAFAPMSVVMTLEDDIDVGRGDTIVRVNNQPNVSQDIEVMLCWLNKLGPMPRAKYILRHTSNESQAIIKEIVYKVDINTLHRNLEDLEIKVNDIARVKIRATKPILFDAYRRNRQTGSLILIDPATNETVAAGMII